jgi:hypothetical protein
VTDRRCRAAHDEVTRSTEGEQIMSENSNEIILKDETDPTDVEGHYLPLDDDGNVDFTPTKDHEVTSEDVEGHVLDLDIERKR